MRSDENTDKHRETGIGIGKAAEILAREFPDVTISSLRFLEGQGLISPARNTGGHRVFSGHDLLRVRRIKQLQSERVPLKDIRERMARSLLASDLSAVVEDVTSFLLNGSIQDAMARLEDVQAAETPLLTLFDDVLTPVMRNLGDDQGNHLIPVDMQLEFDQQLISFISRITVIPDNVTGYPVVLAACPPWERHDIPLRMLMALLEERGASVHFIGSQVESGFARDANLRIRPDVILVSLTLPPSRQAHRWFNDLLTSMRPGQTLLVGGMGAADLNISDSENVKLLRLASYGETLTSIYTSCRNPHGPTET